MDECNQSVSLAQNFRYIACRPAPMLGLSVPMPPFGYLPVRLRNANPYKCNHETNSSLPKYFDIGSSAMPRDLL